MIPLTTVFPTHPSNLMVVAEATEAEVERKRDSLTLPLSWPETKWWVAKEVTSDTTTECSGQRLLLDRRDTRTLSSSTWKKSADSTPSGTSPLSVSWWSSAYTFGSGTPRQAWTRKNTLVFALSLTKMEAPHAMNTKTFNAGTTSTSNLLSWHPMVSTPPKPWLSNKDQSGMPIALSTSTQLHWSPDGSCSASSSVPWTWAKKSLTWSAGTKNQRTRSTMSTTTTDSNSALLSSNSKIPLEVFSESSGSSGVFSSSGLPEPLDAAMVTVKMLISPQVISNGVPSATGSLCSSTSSASQFSADTSAAAKRNSRRSTTKLLNFTDLPKLEKSTPTTTSQSWPKRKTNTANFDILNQTC